MVKGGPSLNPSGRPKGFAGMSAEIARRTQDGNALIDFAWELWQDEKNPIKVRWDAFVWLSERGPGKPVQNVNIDATVREEPTMDVSRIPPSKREAFRELHRRTLEAAKALLAEGEDEAIEVEAIDSNG